MKGELETCLPFIFTLRVASVLLSPRATICYVVGNRRVKGVMLPTDEFVVDAFRQHGFEHKNTIVRNIPNKRMPKKNSPSNIAGETSTTMHKENICRRIMRKLNLRNGVQSHGIRMGSGNAEC